MKSNKGFTLIELLVVVAIIGVLATVVLSSLSSARSYARDSRRESNIRSIQTALEMYYLDNGKYPASGGASSPNIAWANSSDASWQTLSTKIGFDLAVDPINDTAGWPGTWGQNYMNYVYFSGSWLCPNYQSYMLVYNLENKDDSANRGIIRCNGNLVKYADRTVGVPSA